MDKAKKYEVMFEFLVFGIVVGVVEDMLAVWLTTGQSITWTTFYIIVAIAIPFAIIGELFADRIDFSKFFRRYIVKKHSTQKQKHK